MKQIYFFLAIWMVTHHSFAQNSLEFTIGPGFNNVTLKGVDQSFRPDRVMHTGVHAQALWNHTLADHFDFVTGVAYREKGFNIDESLNTNVFDVPIKIGVKANTTLKYAEIPMYLKFKSNEGPVRFTAFAGPSIGYAMSGTVQTRANMLIDININKTTLNLSDDIYNRLELSANAGLGAEFTLPSGSIVASINYQQGLQRVIDNTLLDFRLKNYGFGAQIGYKINF